jgi:hypothetical protein
LLKNNEDCARIRLAHGKIKPKFAIIEAEKMGKKTTKLCARIELAHGKISANLRLASGKIAKKQRNFAHESDLRMEKSSANLGFTCGLG